jgi:hypothetical protein
MKKFLAVAALLAVTSVHADEAKFGDLNYFFKQGQLNLTSDFMMNRELSRVDGEDIEIEGYVSSNKVTIGLMDNLNLFVGLNYLYEFETDIEVGGTSEIRGLQNPIVGGSFRVLNQADGGFNLDVGATADFNLMDYEVAEAGDESGNTVDPQLSYYGDPRSSLVLNARLGNKWNEANEFYLVSSLAYNKDGEYEDKDSDEDVDLDSSMDLSLGAFYQYRPIHEFMMTFGLTGTRFGEIDGEVANTDFTIQDHLDFTFSFVAKYLITESFIAKFHFSQDRRSDFDVEVDGAADIENERRSGLQYGLGVDFLF